MVDFQGGNLSSVAGTGADDTFAYDYGIGRIDGGNGFDTLQPVVASNWDLRRGQLSVLPDREDYVRVFDVRLASIERIDLSLAAGSSVYLSDEVIRRLPQSRPGLPFGLAKSLVVLGGPQDTIHADLNVGEYELVGMNETRRVYRRIGASYGLEISPNIVLAPE